jgi:hypothetical protein
MPSFIEHVLLPFLVSVSATFAATNLCVLGVLVISILAVLALFYLKRRKKMFFGGQWAGAVSTMIIGSALFFGGSIWLGIVNDKIRGAKNFPEKVAIWSTISNDCINKYVNVLRGMDGTIKNWGLMVKTSLPIELKQAVQLQRQPCGRGWRAAAPDFWTAG